MCWRSAYKWRHLFCRSLAFTLQALIWQESQCSRLPPSPTPCSALSFGKRLGACKRTAAKSAAAEKKRYSVGMVWLQFDLLVAGLEACGSQYLQYSLLWGGECILAHGGCATQSSSEGRFHSRNVSSCSTALFPNFIDEILGNGMYRWGHCWCNSGGLNSTGTTTKRLRYTLSYSLNVL